MTQRHLLTAALAALALTAVACKDKGNTDKPLAPAVFGKVVAPPGELGKLKVGMAVAEAKQLAPGLVPKADTYDVFEAGYKGMRFGVGLTEDKQRIDRLTLDVPASARAMLIDAWGPGQDADCASRKCVYWLDAATGVRAIMKDGYDDDLDIEFTDYLPVAKLLGTTPGALGLETGPVVLGSKLEALRAAYKGALVEQAADEVKGDKKMEWFELPPTAYESYWTRINLSLAHGRVTDLRFSIPYDDFPPAKDTILAAFEAAWGKGLAIKDNIDRPKTVWLDPATGRRAALDATFEGTLQIEIDAYMPVDKFLGAGPDKLGFETTPLLGLSWAELAAAYPESVETETDEEAAAKRKDLEKFMGADKDKLAVLGAAKGGTSFTVAGTEWGSGYTLVHLRYDGAGVVRQFALDLPWGDHPAAKDAILAALEHKYGGKKDITKYGGTEYLLRAANPKVTVKNSDITKNWQLEVGDGP